MAVKRKGMGKRLRFEVFKRDSFKCQYCGKSAPEAVLEVDHIHPVSEGGENEITNLITACFDCNSGKSNKLLDDNSVVVKQKRQLDEINEKRVQLEMLSEWRTELSKLDEKKIDILGQVWEEGVGEKLNLVQRNVFKPLLKKFELPMLIESLEASISQYLKLEKTGEPTEKSVEKVLDYVEKIAISKKRMVKNPDLKLLYYSRGILRNRLEGKYLNDKVALHLLVNANKKGATADSLQELCKTIKNWTEFKTSVERFLNDNVPIEQSVLELRSVAG